MENSSSSVELSASQNLTFPKYAPYPVSQENSREKNSLPLPSRLGNAEAGSPARGAAGGAASGAAGEVADRQVRRVPMIPVQSNVYGFAPGEHPFYSAPLASPSGPQKPFWSFFKPPPTRPAARSAVSSPGTPRSSFFLPPDASISSQIVSIFESDDENAADTANRTSRRSTSMPRQQRSLRTSDSASASVSAAPRANVGPAEQMQSYHLRSPAYATLNISDIHTEDLPPYGSVQIHSARLGAENQDRSEGSDGHWWDEFADFWSFRVRPSLERICRCDFDV